MKGIRREMKNNKLHKAASSLIILCGVLSSLSACSGSSQGVPELITPPSAPEFFIKAEKGKLEYRDAVCATVLPEMSVVYSEDPLYLKKINYRVGDKVNKGDVVALGESSEYTDIESLKRELAEAKKELSYENSIYSLERRKSDLMIGIYEKNKQSDMVQSTKDSQRISSVSHSYNVNRRKKRISELNEQLTKGEKAVLNSEMKAEVSGTVFYTKDYSGTAYCEANECVAVIADDSRKVLYVPGQYESTEDAFEMFTVIDGKEVPLKRIPVSEEEKKNAFSQDIPLNVLYECPSDKLNAGDQIPVYKRMVIKDDCIRVYSSAVFESADEQYVYVKTSEGKEKRTVTTGQTMLGMTEIVSGLKEGEEYYYKFAGSIPASYDLYTVKDKDFVISREGGPENDIDDTVIYTAKYDLEVESSESGNTVIENDPIMTVDYTPLRSDVLADEIEILQADAYDQSASLREQLKYLRSKEYPEDMDPEELKVMKEIDNLDIRIININLERASAQITNATWRAKKDLAERNKNKGVKETITSDFTGNINNNAKAGDRFKKGDVLYSSDKTSVTNSYSVYDKAVACMYNKKVKFKSKNKKQSFKGTVVGYKDDAVSEQSTYISKMIGGKPVVFKLPALGQDSVNVVRAEDGVEMSLDLKKDKYRSEINEIELKDVLSVPSQCVFWELVRHAASNERNEEDGTKQEPDVYKPYVIVKTGDYYVKRYVEVYRSSSADPEIWITGNLQEGEQLLKPNDASYQTVNKMKDYSKLESEAADYHG